MQTNFKHIKIIIGILIFAGITLLIPALAYDTNMSPEVYRSYGRQQQKAKDVKGNTILLTPNYESYADRNKNVSEKVVAIYDKRSPAYGYRYVLYSPIGNFVGHHKLMQPSLNGYGGYDPIPDGGEGSNTPCISSLREAKHFYYRDLY